ncbi:hypothetical protein TNCV_2141871 [Trichonephila clavipes]|uniref:Uncharacterized protein n=1 Tax=Trichonephila clavipes TaxID=2585209 RepID=A0A8X6RXM2_TRICX|nr:hypothetical protein TNCV_2141871 [Trichonephila clavipes]
MTSDASNLIALLTAHATGSSISNKVSLEIDSHSDSITGTIYTQKPLSVAEELDKIIEERILFSDEAHFWLNGYVNKQNCRISSEANPQVYVETPLHPEKLTVWCALWAGGILLQKR